MAGIAIGPICSSQQNLAVFVKSRSWRVEVKLSFIMFVLIHHWSFYKKTYTCTYSHGLLFAAHGVQPDR